MNDGILSYGPWHQVAVSYDGNIIKLYIDGALNITSDADHNVWRYIQFNSINTISSYNDKLLIGRGIQSGDSGQFFGDIKGVAIYNIALIDSEIAGLSAIPDSNASGLVSLYDFSTVDRSTWTIKDKVDNGVLGIIGFN